MYIEILSVSKNKELDSLDQHSQVLREKLEDYGFYLMSVKKTLIHPALINSALNSIAGGREKPDVVVIANALNTKDSKSFRKYFVETLVASERAENEPAPKDYWKKHNKEVVNAKKRGASAQELEELKESLKLTRKKAKAFSLGDFGNGYRGYCFMYKGMRVAVVPKAVLTGREVGEIAALAAVRVTELYENSAGDFPEGFSEQKYFPPKTGFANQFIPLRSDTKKEVGRKLVVIAAFLVFVCALAMLFYNMVFLSVKNESLNGTIRTIAYGGEEDDHAPEEKKDEGGINWKKLKNINEEIVGWIKINDTRIDYPVLWHKGDDMNSQYYLNHDYNGNYDSYGTVFVDYRCKKGTDSKNVVLHAHHMNDGSMFSGLMSYGGTTGDLDFYKKAPTIEFDTPDADGVYKIISVFKTNTLSSQGEFFNYMIGDFQNEKDFMNYVYNVRMRSLFNCPVTVNEDDELLTLSTCSYEYTNFRTVVVARRVRLGEDPKVDVSKASLNGNAVWPQVYYSSRGGTRPTLTDFSTAYEKGEIKWYDGEYGFKNQKVASDTTQADSTGSSTAQPTTEPKIYHTVKFINYDGSLISTEQVEDGKAATKPADPKKPSDDYYDYIFKGWQLDYSNITTDMINAPIFEPKLKPEFQQTQGG